MVRCGACRTQFDVATEGRHACPTCGAVNQVSAGQPSAAGQPPAAGQQGPGPPSPFSPPGIDPLLPPPEQPPPAPSPVQRVSCSECSFEFVVGDIEVATCPNCSSEVGV